MPNTNRRNTAMAQGAAGGVEEANFPLDVDLLHAHLAEHALLDFLLDTHERQESHAGVVLHQLADGFNGGHLDVHAERDFVALEFAQNDFAVGGNYVVGDEDFRAKLGDGNGLALRETVDGGDDEGQRVGVNGAGLEALVGGIVTDDAEFEVAVQEFVGDLARETAAYLHFDLGVEFAVALDVAEQIENGGLVGTDDEPAGGIVAQFVEGVIELLVKVLKADRKS